MTKLLSFLVSAVSLLGWLILTKKMGEVSSDGPDLLSAIAYVSDNYLSRDIELNQHCIINHTYSVT